MKRTADFLFTVILLIAVTLVIAVIPTEMDVAIYEDTIRLHILANSDSAEDQTLKYEIRDMLLEKYSDRLSESASIDEAKSKTSLLCSDMERDVEEWMKERGYEYECNVSLGVEWYETREYEDFILPKGYYTSLKVMLGEAEGKNWWCVMYPPLCLDVATEEVPRKSSTQSYTKVEKKLITKDGYNVKFKVLELLSDAFSKNG